MIFILLSCQTLAPDYVWVIPSYNVGALNPNLVLLFSTTPRWRYFSSTSIVVSISLTIDYRFLRYRTSLGVKFLLVTEASSFLAELLKSFFADVRASRQLRGCLVLVLSSTPCVSPSWHPSNMPDWSSAPDPIKFRDTPLRLYAKHRRTLGFVIPNSPCTAGINLKRYSYEEGDYWKIQIKPCKYESLKINTKWIKFFEAICLIRVLNWVSQNIFNLNSEPKLITITVQFILCFLKVSLSSRSYNRFTCWTVITD